MNMAGGGIGDIAENIVHCNASPAPAGITIVNIVNPMREIVRDFENAHGERGVCRPLIIIINDDDDD